MSPIVEGHCALTIAPNANLVVDDLMTERGYDTFVSLGDQMSRYDVRIEQLS